MIYTSYFAKIRKFPEGMMPISICAFTPKFYDGIEYKKLAPTKDILLKYKEDCNEEEYDASFNKEVLSLLDPKVVENELLALANGKTPVLCCYEKSSDFCHRKLVSKWLNEAGIECTEIDL